ncbi:hypothetical protein SSTU70S_04761 [Stutzerimonas stutzeri]
MGDLHFDELTGFGIQRTARCDQDLLLDLGVVGNHEADVVLDLIAPDDGFMGSTDDLDNRPLATPTPIQPGHPRQAAIAIENQAHLRRPEKEVIATVIGNQGSRSHRDDR